VVERLLKNLAPLEGRVCLRSPAQVARLRAALDKGPAVHGWADGHVAGVDVGDDVQVVVDDIGRPCSLGGVSGEGGRRHPHGRAGG
jgi:hypothetical protein